MAPVLPQGLESSWWTVPVSLSVHYKNKVTKKNESALLLQKEYTHSYPACSHVNKCRMVKILSQKYMSHKCEKKCKMNKGIAGIKERKKVYFVLFFFFFKCYM